MDDTKPPIGTAPNGGADTKAEPKPDPALEALKTQAAQGQEQIASLASQVQSLTATLMALAQRPQAPPEEIDAEALREDPEAALDLHFDRRAKPIVDNFRQAAAATAKNVAKMDPKRAATWARYEKEIEAAAASMTDEQRANPDAYAVLHDFIISRHQDELLQERLKEERTKWEQERALPAGGSLPGTAGSGKAAAEPTPLTDTEKFIAKRFRMTEEEYAKYKAEHEADIDRQSRRTFGMEH